jgi:serine/threonine-protein kinase RsbW
VGFQNADLGITSAMGPLRMLAPPEHIRVLLTWEPARDLDLRRIRDGILRYFAANDGAAESEDGEIAETIGLAATELVANALLHGRAPVIVRLLRDDDCFVLDVSDSDVHGVPKPSDAPRGIQAGGRGLRIVLSIAQQAGWYATSTAKHVWASFPAR